MKKLVMWLARRIWRRGYFEHALEHRLLAASNGFYFPASSRRK